MPEKMLRINCVCYWNGQCLHQAAPRRFFGPSDCLLVQTQRDPRVPEGCSLQVTNEKPNPPASPPRPKTYSELVWDKSSSPTPPGDE